MIAWCDAHWQFVVFACLVVIVGLMLWALIRIIKRIIKEGV